MTKIRQGACGVGSKFNNMENYYRLINELRNLAEKCLTGHPEPRTEKEVILLYSIGKADKTLCAIILLCYKGMGEDAAILCRSLFELALNVQYIFQDKSDSLAKRYCSYDWIQRKIMFGYLKKSTLAKELDDPEKNKIIKEIEEKASEAQSLYKYNQFGWSDKSIRKMAEHLGKLNMYETVYRIQCSLGHSNPRSANEYFKIIDNQLILDSGPSDNFVKEVLVASFGSYYELLVEFNGYFKKRLDKKLKELETEFVNELGVISK